jgi:hypothetical protein
MNHSNQPGKNENHPVATLGGGITLNHAEQKIENYFNHKQLFLIE